MKVFNIIAGVISFLAGMACIASPFVAQLMVAYVDSIVIGIMGIVLIIGVIVTRKEREEARAAGMNVASGGLGVLVGVLGIIFMLLNINVPLFTYTTQHIGAVILMIYLCGDGLVTIVANFADPYRTLGMRILGVILGILMIGAAGFGIANPPAVIASFGLFMGVGFIIAGVNRVVFAFSE